MRGETEITARVARLDLGWVVSEELNLLLVQPLYRAEESQGEVGRLRDEFRESQGQVVSAVAELIRDPSKRLLDYWQPLHAVLLPELCVPRESIRDLLDALAQPRTPPGMLVAAGIERLSTEEYSELLGSHATDEKWRGQEMASLENPQYRNDMWINAMLLAWHERDGKLGVAFQRKITPSAHERETLCCGDTVHVLVINGASFVFTICSDMLNVPPGGGRCSVADAIVRHFGGGGQPGTLDALVHIQCNRHPNHGLMQAGFYRLLVESPRTVGEACRGAMVVRVNAAARCEESDEYGLTGVLVGGHRRYHGRAPRCCCRSGGDIVCYDLRPRRASAFVLRTRLPSRTPGPEGAAGIQPVTGGLWVGLRPGDLEIDFSRGEEAIPEAYRFAGWRALPRELRSGTGTNLLEVAASRIRDELEPKLARGYRQLRRACWGRNGDFLSRWGRKALSFAPAEVRDDPDKWTAAHLDHLKRLVAGLAMLHAWFPLAPAESSAAPGCGAALSLGGGARWVHSRHACDKARDTVRAWVSQDAETSNALSGDIYVVSAEAGASESEFVQVGGLMSPGAPTYAAGQVGDRGDIARPGVVLVPVGRIEHWVRQGLVHSLADIREKLVLVLAGEGGALAT